MNKNKLDVMMPKFVSEFVCVGSDCTASCCNTWKISVNKKVYKELKKHGDIEIRQLAASTFTLTRESDRSYAQIKMSDHGDCPILDENKLCAIHKKCGPHLLPHTCQDYPRTPKWFGEHVEMSMSLSCPEVVKNLLYDPEAMVISSVLKTPFELNHGNISGVEGEHLPPYLPVIRDFCFSVGLKFELTFEQRLFIIGMYLKLSDSYLGDLQRLAELAENFNLMITDGTLIKHYEKLPEVPTVKWSLFSEQETLFVPSLYLGNTLSASSIRKHDSFIQCQEMLMKSLASLENTENYKSSTVSDNNQESAAFTVANMKQTHHRYSQILRESKQYLDSHFSENPQVLNNFLLYSIYNDQFLSILDKSPLEYFKVLVLDILMLKSYLSGIAYQQSDVTKDWVVNLFQGYYRRRNHAHYRSVTEFMNEKIKLAEEQSEYIIFSLLKG